MNCAIDRFIASIRCRRLVTSRIIAILSILTFTIAGLWSGESSGNARAAMTIQNSYPVTCVSAASYLGSPGALAPNSIVAAFGTQLATGTLAANSLPLPTSLLTTRVTVAGIPAPLFFDSTNQINYLIPENAPTGDVEVLVTSTIASGDQVISRGQMRIAGTGPAIFTADSSGGGAPAAITGRINQNDVFVYDPNPPYRTDPANPGRIIPAPIDVGTTERPAFLILFGTGIRNALPNNIRAIIGGLDIPVEYYGPAGGYAGLDQVNLRLPASLKGRGLVDVTIVVNGVSSNFISLDLAGTTGQALTISGFGISTPALAGQTVTISGNGFSSNPSDNIVRFGPAQARVIAAAINQLTVIVPFGAQSGQVTVQANQIEARSVALFRVRTSISGIIQSTGTPAAPPLPLNNVTVRLAGTNISVRTTAQGTFVLSDIPAGVSLVEVDGATSAATPPYPSISLKLAAKSDRDNQFSQPISLQQINGGTGSVGGVIGNTGINTLNQFSQLRSDIVSAFSRIAGRLGPLAESQFSPLAKSVFIGNRGVTLEVPFGTNVRFPDGKSSGQVQLTVLEGARLPGITIPAGINTRSIAQITPIGTKFQPGVSISFPNPDPTNLGPGAKLTLYRYDPATGSFVRRGTGVVSSDRTLVNSDGRVVDLATFWLLATSARMTTVNGRVVDLQGRPVSGAKVTANGRASLSDQNGGFSIPDVSPTDDNRVRAEAILPQQFGTPPRGFSALSTAVVGGITSIGNITLTNTNQAGLVLSPFAIDLKPGQPGSAPFPVNVTLTEPAPSGGLAITLSSDDRSVVTVPASLTIPAGQTTASFNITTIGSGTALISAQATLRTTAIEASAVVSISLPGPVLSKINPITAPAGARLTITGTGLNAVPNNHFVSLFRNNELLALLNPFENEVVSDSSGKPALVIRLPDVPPGLVSLAVSVIDPVSGVVSENSAPIAFTVSESTLLAPQLSNTIPGQGKPRDQITIIGTGFSSVREENHVRFIQTGQAGAAIDAQIVKATPTSIVVTVPALVISRGEVSIIARRIESSGAASPDSNSLTFNIISDPVSPLTPLLANVANVANGTPSGKDGDLIRASGRDFGGSFFNLQVGQAGNQTTSDPILTLLVFTQNNEFVNFTVPINASGGTVVEAVVPSGLRKGAAAITVFNFDTETGLMSEESLPNSFNITESTDFRIDEEEPNDAPDFATRVFFPSRVQGRIATGDPGSLTIVFNSTTKIVLSDLFSFNLDQVLRGTIALTFNKGADLDLFVLRRNDRGKYEVIASSTTSEGTLESLTGDLPPGQYLIGVGAFSGSTPYLLSLQYASTIGSINMPLMKYGEVIE